MLKRKYEETFVKEYIENHCWNDFLNHVLNNDPIVLAKFLRLNKYWRSRVYDYVKFAQTDDEWLKNFSVKLLKILAPFAIGVKPNLEYIEIQENSPAFVINHDFTIESATIDVGKCFKHPSAGFLPIEYLIMTIHDIKYSAYKKAVFRFPLVSDAIVYNKEKQLKINNIKNLLFVE